MGKKKSSYSDEYAKKWGFQSGESMSRAMNKPIKRAKTSSVIKKGSLLDMLIGPGKPKKKGHV